VAPSTIEEAMSIEQELRALRAEIVRGRGLPTLLTLERAAWEMMISVSTLRQLIKAGRVVESNLDEGRKSRRVASSEVLKFAPRDGPKLPAPRGGGRKKSSSAGSPRDEAQTVRDALKKRS
jgi:hypothetical protein